MVCAGPVPGTSDCLSGIPVLCGPTCECSLRSQVSAREVAVGLTHPDESQFFLTGETMREMLGPPPEGSRFMFVVNLITGADPAFPWSVVTDHLITLHDDGGRPNKTYRTSLRVADPGGIELSP